MAGRKRHDPISRAADGRQSFDRIKGKAPDRVYVLANPNDEQTGVAYYQDELGYEIEISRPGGPRATGRTLAEGSEVRSGGMVLMSCAVERRAEWDARLAVQSNEAERRILRDEGMEDGLRGRMRVRDVYEPGYAPE